MADESPRALNCVHCGRSCACKPSQGGESSKRPASLLGVPTDDDVPSDERSKRLARSTLDALHPKAVDELEPEFSVVKKWKSSTVPDHVLLQGVRHESQIACEMNRRAQDHQGQHL
jgi:hypothetical protein